MGTDEEILDDINKRIEYCEKQLCFGAKEWSDLELASFLKSYLEDEGYIFDDLVVPMQHLVFVLADTHREAQLYIERAKAFPETATSNTLPCL
mgnify:CR=1 FL=1